MTFDGPSRSPRSTTARRCPAQHAIEEFLAVHRDRPVRTVGARLMGRSPLDESCAGRYWEAVGELEVVAKLDRLGAGWVVIHGLPGATPADEPEASAIDHLVIGPAGVFSVTTHNHSRQNVWVSERAFVVDGHHLQHIRRAEAAAGHVERMLEAAVGRHIEVTTIIAVIDAGSLQARDLPRDVYVVAASSLDSWLKARERQLGPLSVAEIAASARTDATWSLSALSSGDAEETARKRTEFDQVRREVVTARMVRVAWAVGVVVTAGALVAVGILQLVSAPLT